MKELLGTSDFSKRDWQAVRKTLAPFFTPNPLTHDELGELFVDSLYHQKNLSCPLEPWDKKDRDKVLGIVAERVKILNQQIFDSPISLLKLIISGELKRSIHLLRRVAARPVIPAPESQFVKAPSE